MASGEVVLQAMMMVRGDEVAPVRLAELQAAVDGDGRAQGVGGIRAEAGGRPGEGAPA